MPILGSDSFTVSIVNYDPNETYTFTSSNGTIVEKAAVGNTLQIFVIGLTAENLTSTLVTVIVTRREFAPVTGNVVG